MIWDDNKVFECGVDHAVLYLLNNLGKYANGVAWSGIQSISESPSGAEPSAFYADNIKYANILSNEEYAATIEAYTYPDEFAACDGSAEIAPGVSIGQQTRATFGLCYRTKIGKEGNQDLAYKLHFVYGCLAAPSEKSHETINDSPDIGSFSWEISTTPVAVTGKKPTATLEIDSRTADADKLAALLNILYGIDAPVFNAAKTYAVGEYVKHTDGSVEKTYVCTTAVTSPAAWDADNWTEVDPAPRMPLPDEVAELMGEVNG